MSSLSMGKGASRADAPFLIQEEMQDKLDYRQIKTGQ